MPRSLRMRATGVGVFVQDVPLYNLMVAQAVKLKPSDAQASSTPTPPLPTQGLVMTVDTLRVTIDPPIGRGTITASSMPLAALVQMVPILDGRVVVDKTGMKGLYDIPDVRIDVGPLETGFRESWPKVLQQLGLKLESARGPVEVLVVDRLQQPTEN
jgi:uncharacterized protein (TIGR03435 family)